MFNFLKFTILLWLGLSACALGLAQGEPDAGAQEGRVDPFLPLVSGDGKLLNLNKDGHQQLEVNGIIYDKEGESFAIVNSAVVKARDCIGEYKVLRIEEDRVIFEKGGQPLEVGLHKEEKD